MSILTFLAQGAAATLFNELLNLSDKSHIVPNDSGTIIPPYNSKGSEKDDDSNKNPKNMNDIFSVFSDTDFVGAQESSAVKGKIYSFFPQRKGQKEGPYSAQEIKDLELPDNTLVTEESINEGHPSHISDLNIDTLCQQEIEYLTALAGDKEP
jgi:hypothetical protein